MIYAGVDEVGRGCLAGPVVACAIILPLDFVIPVMDSKKCSPKKRKQLAEEIQASAVSYSFGIIDNNIIDEQNILNATLLAMVQAVHTLSLQPERIYIDGNIPLPQSLMDEYQLRCEQVTIIQGDALHPSISSASILAKVYRDTLMQSFAEMYPVYGFEKHKGYGTKEHKEAIQKYGSSPLHRKTFSGVL